MVEFTEEEEQSYQELKQFIDVPEFMIKHLLQMAAAEGDYTKLDDVLTAEARAFLRVVADFVDTKTTQQTHQ